MSCTHNIRPGDSYYQEMVDRIRNLVGITYEIPVFASDTTGGACATLVKRCNCYSCGNCSCEDGKPIIAYNPYFVQDLSYWATMAVFSHEVAHHHNKDLHGKYVANLFGYAYSKSHKQELNADMFAGWVLRYEGASLAQALQMYDEIKFVETKSHPAASRRKEAMKQGWWEAERQINPVKQNYSIKKSYEPELGGAFALAGLFLLIAAFSKK